MPRKNDHGVQVSVIKDFRKLNKWVAPNKRDFRKVQGTRIVNAKNLDLSGIQGYIPDTYHEFEVKNVLNKKGKVCQAVKGPWQGTKLEIAMSQLNLELNCDDEENPYLVDDDIRVMSDDGVELAFAGRWLIRGWKVDLVVNKNRNGVREVEFFRDEIRWVKVPNGQDEPDEGLEAFSSTYWIPY